MKAAIVKAKRGSAYLFATIIVMTAAVMLAVSLQVTRYGAKLSYAALNNEDLHYLSADAAEIITKELNGLLRSRLGDIEREVNERFIKESIKMNITDYAAYNAESGEFHLKQKDSARASGEINTLYSSYFISAAEEILYDDIESLIRSRRVWEINEREISAIFWREEEGLGIEVTARNPQTGASKKILAQVALVTPAHGEIIYEQYEFQTRPDYLQAANGGVTLSAADFTGESELPEYFKMNGEWSGENSVIFVEDGETVDADLFLGIPTLLIAEGDVRLGGGAYDFSGLIYAAGNVIIDEEVFVRGAIAAGEVTLPESDEEDTNEQPGELPIVYEDNFIDIKISDRRLKQDVYDYLGLTNFAYKAEGYVEKTAELKEEVLKYLKLSPDFGLAVSEVPEFTIMTMQ